MNMEQKAIELRNSINSIALKTASIPSLIVTILSILSEVSLFMIILRVSVTFFIFCFLGWSTGYILLVIIPESIKNKPLELNEIQSSEQNLPENILTPIDNKPKESILALESEKSSIPSSSQSIATLTLENIPQNENQPVSNFSKNKSKKRLVINT